MLNVQVVGFVHQNGILRCFCDAFAVVGLLVSRGPEPRRFPVDVYWSTNQHESRMHFNTEF